jgi:hypothetical protein
MFLIVQDGTPVAGSRSLNIQITEVTGCLFDDRGLFPDMHWFSSSLHDNSGLLSGESF